jgi:hypothetical protein
MWKLRRIVVPVLLLSLFWTAAPAFAATTTLHISKTTSAIYLYDPSPFGTGPFYPATTVTAVIKNCPTGEYFMSAELVQDGVAAFWATGALGAGEVFCHQEGFSTVTWSMGFYSPTLHPGTATATFTIRSNSAGDVPLDVTDTRTVRIPG